MGLSKNQRKLFLSRYFSDIECLQKYKHKKLLASGTIGTVFLVHSENDVDHAVKLQILNNEQEESYFKNEIKSQKAFYPKAPKIFNHCIDTIKNHRIGVIEMELTDGELDKELSTKLTETKLKKIIEEISNLLKFAKEHKYIHGDLALFNISFVCRPNKQREMIFIDFDRSSLKKFKKYEKLDSMRIISELFDNSRSSNTKPLNKFNVQYLITKGIPIWKKFGLLTAKEISSKTIDNEWSLLFCEYCHDVNVLCLDNNACQVIFKKLKLNVESSKSQKTITQIIPKIKPQHIQQQIFTRMKLRSHSSV